MVFRLNFRRVLGFGIRMIPTGHYRRCEAASQSKGAQVASCGFKRRSISSKTALC
jgi:hypothetical protein